MVVEFEDREDCKVKALGKLLVALDAQAVCKAELTGLMTWPFSHSTTST